jgi:hypothetical protein
MLLVGRGPQPTRIESAADRTFDAAHGASRPLYHADQMTHIAVHTRHMTSAFGPDARTPRAVQASAQAERVGDPDPSLSRAEIARVPSFRPDTELACRREDAAPCGDC